MIQPPCSAKPLNSLHSLCLDFRLLLLGALLGMFPATLSAQSGPQASVATELRFGAISFGTSLTLTLPVMNTGSAPLTIVPSVNGPSYRVVGGEPTSCLGETPPGQTCTLTIDFSPIAVGYHYDILTLQTNGTSNPAVQLKGEATGVGIEQEAPLDFGTIPFGTTKTLQLVVNNLGVSSSVTVKGSINGPSYKFLTATPNNFSVSPSNCFTGIKEGQSCLVQIEFSPTVVGHHGDVLTLTPSIGAASTVRLDGTLSSDPTTTPPASGNIYVLDSGNNRVQIFNRDGVYQSQFSTSNFFIPTGIAVDADYVYVTSGDHSCQVEKFDGDGDQLLQFGLCNGEGPGYLEIDGTVATDAGGNLWATDGDGYLEHFDSNGNFLSLFCTSTSAAKYVPDCPLATDFTIADVYPVSIGLDLTGNIYITTLNFPAVVKFGSSGNYLLSFGSMGSGNGQFTQGFSDGIAVSSTGDIYVVDSGNNRVQIFDANGNYKSQFGTYGTGDGQFKYPSALAFDAEGNLYVTDIQGERVEKFDSNGAYLSQFGSFRPRIFWPRRWPVLRAPGHRRCQVRHNERRRR